MRQGLFITDEELTVFNQLVGKVPYELAKPMERFFAQIRQNRDEEQRQMEEAHKADILRKEAEEAKAKEALANTTADPSANLKAVPPTNGEAALSPEAEVVN